MDLTATVQDGLRRTTSAASQRLPSTPIPSTPNASRFVDNESRTMIGESRMMNKRPKALRDSARKPFLSYPNACCE